MRDVSEKLARTRMVELCSQRPADSHVGQFVQITASGKDFNFSSADGCWWAEHKVERIGMSSWDPKKSWARAARGIAILEEIGNAGAIEVLQAMADGHADAFPTKAAQESLKRLKK